MRESQRKRRGQHQDRDPPQQQAVFPLASRAYRPITSTAPMINAAPETSSRLGVFTIVFTQISPLFQLNISKPIPHILNEHAHQSPALGHLITGFQSRQAGGHPVIE